MARTTERKKATGTYINEIERASDKGNDNDSSDNEEGNYLEAKMKPSGGRKTSQFTACLRIQSGANTRLKIRLLAQPSNHRQSNDCLREMGI